MAMTATVKIEGLSELKRKLGPGPARTPINRFLDRSAIFCQSAARTRITEQGAVDTGRTRNSIGVRSPGDLEREIGPNTTYAEVIEKGRAAGATMPPAGVLLPWMARHGIEAHNEFVIRRAIGRKGIKARPFMEPAARDTEAFMRTLVNVLAQELEVAYRDA